MKPQMALVSRIVKLARGYVFGIGADMSGLVLTCKNAIGRENRPAPADPGADHAVPEHPLKRTGVNDLLSKYPGKNAHL